MRIVILNLTLVGILVSLTSLAQEEVPCDQMNDLEIGKMIIGLEKISELTRVLDSCGCTYSISKGKGGSKYNLMLHSKNGGIKNWEITWGYIGFKYVSEMIDIYYNNSIKSDMMDIVEYNVLADKIDFKGGKLKIKKKIGRGSSRLYLTYIR